MGKKKNRGKKSEKREIEKKNGKKHLKNGGFHLRKQLMKLLTSE